MLATLAVVAGFVTLAHLRGALSRVVGDEGTYLAMIESVAFDGDLEFGEADRERVSATGEAGRQALILQRAEGVLSYSKPMVFAVLAAPAYQLLGERGVIAFNVGVLLLACYLAGIFLRRLGESERAGWTLLTFVGASVILPYVVYRMSDLMQVALAIAGGVLAVAGAREVAPSAVHGQRLLSSGWAPYAGGVLFGLLGVARYPNFLVPAGVVFALVVAGRWRRAAAVLVATAAVTGAASLAAELATGAVTPYKAERATFNRATGYPQEVKDGIAETGFEVRRATQHLGVKPIFQPVVSAYAAGYFTLGRHTGALIYFPALIALVITALRRPDRLGLALLATAFGGFVFYVVWMPGNYFGGATFIGNRYFLTVYPLCLLALPRLPGKGVLVASWALALVVFGSASASVLRSGEAARHSQSHAFAGIFRALPFESTARNMDGRRDRFWSGDFLRFQDPYARVEEDGWLLTSGRPGSDVEIVSRHPGDRLDFLVRSPSEDVELVVSDWRSRAVYPVRKTETGRGRLVAVETSPPWRRHPFWWVWYEPYDARLLRLSIRAATQTEVELRYLGTTMRGMFDAKVHKADIPQQAAAGGEATLHLRVRNMSHYPWYRDGVVPVGFVYGLTAQGEAAPAVEPSRIPLPHDVVSGDPVDLEAPIRWPDQPGIYQFVFDLQYGDLASFAERTGSPLIAAEVVVERRPLN